MDIVVISSAFVRNEEPKKQVTRVPAQKTKIVENRRNRSDRRKRTAILVSGWVAGGARLF